MSGDRVAVGTDDPWPEDADEEEGFVANWFVREGATVEAGDVLCEIQVEKVSVDVLAPVDGELVEVVLGEDAEFRRGETLAYIRPT
ncbi:biotin attachment protein [Natronomonas salina]|uniref:lipoyl domain-containing protein n=1 Tax=Natronomonas salina TaxID=1710540 RepID=UPI0015B6E308|nr:lipoyl domain-containing protein [Natronomonas salina]QLD90428.1 biotin attachment protein [Natronomonas salina]